MTYARHLRQEALPSRAPSTRVWQRRRKANPHPRASFLIRLDDDSLALVDTGMSRLHIADPDLTWRGTPMADLLFPGVEVIPTPGHAPGHQSVLLRLPESGSVIVCGDAVYCQENFDHDAWGGQADPETARMSALSLRDTADRQSASMICGHDRNQIRTLRFSTDSYR
jgi:N-acyl homoserine lactone hydrolase